MCTEYNIPLSQIDRSNRQKRQGQILELNSAIKNELNGYLQSILLSLEILFAGAHVIFFKNRPYTSS